MPARRRVSAVSRGATALLVNVPRATAWGRSLPLGIIKVLLEREGVGCDVTYLNLGFAELCGADQYEALALHGGEASEWVFAEALREAPAPAGGRTGSRPT